MPHSPEGGREFAPETERFTPELTLSELDLIITAMVREREVEERAIQDHALAATKGRMSQADADEFAREAQERIQAAEDLKMKLLNLSRRT